MRWVSVTLTSLEGAVELVDFNSLSSIGGFNFDADGFEFWEVASPGPASFVLNSIDGSRCADILLVPLIGIVVEFMDNLVSVLLPLVAHAFRN